MLNEVQAAVAARPADSAFILLLDFDGPLAEFSADPAAPQLTPSNAGPPGPPTSLTFGMPGQARSWQAWADAERERVLARAYSPDLGFFTQALDPRTGSFRAWS